MNLPLDLENPRLCEKTEHGGEMGFTHLTTPEATLVDYLRTLKLGEPAVTTMIRGLS